MAVSVSQRPLGFVLGAAVSAPATNNAGTVRITKTSHGLTTGAYVYIYSPVLSYNGYTQIAVSGANTIELTLILYTVDTTVSYYPSIYTHGWQSVHLPIFYKITNTRWPINFLDTSRNYTSYSNDSGYVDLVVSASLGTFSSLDYVKISGATDDRVNGVFQVITKNSTSDITINLAYDAGYVFTNGIVQLYYNNYTVLIKIYGGLTSAHVFQAQKPYTLLNTKEQRPDSDGIVNIDISKELKTEINSITNNLLHDFLPINLDAFCQFYIEIAESYDFGGDTFTSSYTSDLANFEGYAVNSRMPFKSRPINTMSDYVYATGAVQKFLTAFDVPTIQPGYYFDISFVNRFGYLMYIVRKVYNISDVLLETFYDSISSYAPGIYRKQITQSGDAESYCTIYLMYRSASDITLSETKRINFAQPCTNQLINITWLNYLGGYDYWVFTGIKDYTIEIGEVMTQDKNIANGWPNNFGEFASTLRREISRESASGLKVRSQNLTSAQVDAISRIKSSPLVQIVNSQYDSRTILVDKSSFKIRSDRDKKFSIEFNCVYTDNLPSQSL